LTKIGVKGKKRWLCTNTKIRYMHPMLVYMAEINEEPELSPLNPFRKIKVFASNST